MNVEVKKGDAQSDYKGGCVDIQSTNPQDCFLLGQLFYHLCTENKAAVKGEWGQGIFIRLPLQDDNDIRPAFIQAMQAEIDANNHKGPWKDFALSREYATDWLREHVEKLIKAINSGRDGAVTEHCADIANIAMKIEEAYGIR